MQIETKPGLSIKRITELLFVEPKTKQTPVEGEETAESIGFASLCPQHKRINILTYSLVALLSMVVVQTIWRIAVLTLPN